MLEARIATHKEMLEHWGFIRSGLASVRRELEGRSFWEPEHIRLALEQSFAAEVRGEAPVCQLWLGWDQQVPQALMVTQLMIDPFLHVPLTLFVWIFYKHPRYPGHLMLECWEQFSHYARLRGCRTLEAMTGIPAYADYLASQGWEKVMTVMRKSLWPEQELVPYQDVITLDQRRRHEKKVS